MRRQKDRKSDKKWMTARKLFPGHSRADMNSQQLRLYAQGLHSLRPYKMLAWRGDTGKVALSAKRPSAVAGYGERESQFSLRMQPLVCRLPPGKGHTSKSLWAASATQVKKKKRRRRTPS